MATDDYVDLVKKLRTRAEIRRKIPRCEPDRIASDCEAAAAAIEELLLEVELLKDDCAGRG